MVRSLDRDIVKGRGVDVPDVEGLLAIFEAHFEHLVEIAIKDFSEPGGVDGVAAHESVYRAGIEGFSEELVVFF